MFFFFAPGYHLLFSPFLEKDTFRPCVLIEDHLLLTYPSCLSSVSQSMCWVYKHRWSGRKAGSETHSPVHSPLLSPRFLPPPHHSPLSSLLSPHLSYSVPRCTRYPLYSHFSALPPLLSPVPLPFSWFIICNMI